MHVIGQCRMSIIWEIAIVLVACLNAISAHGLESHEQSVLISVENSEGLSRYSSVALRPAMQDLTRIGLRDCVEIWEAPDNSILAACKYPSDDTKEDYGLRIFSIVKGQGGPMIRSKSSGAGDAYSARISELKRSNGHSDEIVLAEFSAEYSYGVWIFQRKGDRLRMIGEIDLGLDDGNGSVSSIVPAMRLFSATRGFVVKFDRDVVRMKSDGTFVNIPSSKIWYVYDGKRLKRAGP